ncbi:PDR/VanB family oxidoreductase [Pseudorhodoferax sp. Leaf267]|uniref:PDR/VanB family oxidoreductase n=1 Tax=Pseudorhodoferax sp. Leaf267 TaxID=1736316 RepID=UPI0006F3709C|nr:PDR/VanB family oxidoreductase [Pseudorhodoferax sp. Leaf267]KQP23464.1 Vanillate O-demethylase oxidoreductase [Pseudorhodoferax sp. Leaf267]
MTGSLRVRVAKKEAVAEGICAFDLVAAEGDTLPAFTAGAHVDVTTPSGIIRQYSLSNPSTDRNLYRIAVLHEQDGRGGSRAMHEQVKAGDVLTISAPRNHFELDVAASPSLLLAGGIGITPILAMAHQLEAQGRQYALHYCTRSPARTAFRDELASRFGERARVYHDDGPAELKFNIADALRTAPRDAHLYVCGPSGFIDAVLSQAKAQGWQDSRVHREFFSAAPVDTAGDKAFEVVVASSGIVIPVAADQTVVAALAACGIEVMTSCEQGVCGTCITHVLEGIPEHRDSYFTDEEHAKGDQFTPCCSRSKTDRLVLDL